MVAHVFDYGVRLARHEGLVDFAAAFHYDGIRAHLSARGKFHHIIQHYLLYGYLLRLAVAHDKCLGRGEQGELVHGAFGAQFLHYAHKRVEHYEDEKTEVAYAVQAVVHETREQHRQDDENKVEKREYVGAQDLCHALGAHGLFAVHLPLRDACFDFRRGQPCGGNVSALLRLQFGGGDVTRIRHFSPWGDC